MEHHHSALPPLIGTPKQIAWAESIRARLVSALDEQEHVTESHSALHSVGYREVMQLHLERQRHLFASIRAHAEARWWIERRGLSVAMLAAAEQRAMKTPPIRYESKKKPRLH